MNLVSYQVTCTQCNGSDVLRILDGKEVGYTNNIPIIAARLRPDMQWGFECQCGNDSRIAPSEYDQVELLVKGGEQHIEAIKQSLTEHNEQKFSMERI